jgi:hypothetical protein
LHLIPTVEVDVELFEDNPTEYIRRDIEGSDLDTRRRAATELVKSLRKYYEKECTDICAAYITTMLQVLRCNEIDSSNILYVAICSKSFSKLASKRCCHLFGYRIDRKEHYYGQGNTIFIIRI